MYLLKLVQKSLKFKKKLLIQSLFKKLTIKPKLFKTKVFIFLGGVKQYLDIKVILQSGDLYTLQGEAHKSGLF